MTIANQPTTKPATATIDTTAAQERDDSPGSVALRERLKVARKVFVTGKPKAA